MRKCLVIAGAIASVLMFASSAAAAGPNGGWGKGLLSETLLFYEGTSDVAGGYMYWNHELPAFVYDFHGYYLESGTVYHLLCYADAGVNGPSEFIDLGSASVCDYLGVHIKGSMTWPDMEGATVCLVPDTWSGLGGSGAWAPDTYLLSETTIDL